MILKPSLCHLIIMIWLLHKCSCFQAKTLTYQFSNLPKSTTQVQNQEGEAGMFTFDFLPDLSTHPKKIEQGVYFTQGGEYLDIVGPLFEYVDFCSIEIWIFVRKISIATFVNMNVTQIVTGANPDVQRIKFIYLLNPQYLFTLFGSRATKSGTAAKRGWNRIAMTMEAGSLSSSEYHPLKGHNPGNSIGLGIENQPYYIGCNFHCSSMEFIFHSFKISSTVDYTVEITPEIFNPYGFRCGDGTKHTQALEECDDGTNTGNNAVNNNNVDCDENCLLGYSYSCDNSIPNSCFPAVCGDGFYSPSEDCDDRNNINGDGCSNSCAKEPGYQCYGIDNQTCEPICGDGIKLGLEACDDNNFSNDDGCNSNCTIESKSICFDQTPTGPSICRVCEIEHCKECDPSDYDKCLVCEDSYKLISSTTCNLYTEEKCDSSESSCDSEEVSSTVAAATTSLTTSSVAFASASSLTSMSSVNSIFSTMNSLQLAILLPLVPDSFPSKVSSLITGVGFSMLSFDFLSFKKIPFVRKIPDWMNYPQVDEYLKSLNIESGSSIVNLLSLIAVILLTGVTHIFITIIHKLCCRSKNNRCSNFCTRLYRYFTFNLYIRILMQALMFICLCIFTEIYTWKLGTTVNKVSFGVAVGLFVGVVVFMGLCGFMYVKSFSAEGLEKYWKWEEFFSGVKSERFAYIYSSLFLSIRFLSGCILIFGREMGALSKAIMFLSLNIVFAVYLVLVKPFKNVQDNIIEAVNQVMFCFLVAPLIWLNTKNDWTKFYQNYYTYAFMISPLIVSCICFVFLVKSVISLIKKTICKSGPQNIAPKEKTKVEKLKIPNNLEIEEGKNEVKNNNSILNPSSDIAGSNSHSVIPLNPHDQAIINKIRSKIGPLKRSMFKRPTPIPQNALN